MDTLQTDAEKLIFTTHALERGLERLFHYKKPYSKEQLKMIKEYLSKAMRFNELRGVWTIPDFNVDVVVVENKVVTVLSETFDESKQYKPLTEYQKKNHKRYLRSIKARNRKKIEIAKEKK